MSPSDMPTKAQAKLLRWANRACSKGTPYGFDRHSALSTATFWACQKRCWLLAHQKCPWMWDISSAGRAALRRYEDAHAE